MKTKFKPATRTRVNAPRKSDVEAEKKVARFMTKFFGVALLAIVAFLVFLWAIGKFE